MILIGVVRRRSLEESVERNKDIYTVEILKELVTNLNNYSSLSVIMHYVFNNIDLELIDSYFIKLKINMSFF